MGLSCGGRTGGPHGRVSTEVGWPTRLHRGVQTGRRPAALEGRKDACAGVARAGHPALREAHQRIRELERLLGKKQMEIEIHWRRHPDAHGKSALGPFW